VLDIIYHQFFFTANSLGRQPTTSQFFQPLAPQTLALVATAIHCALSEYATGKKITVMFSQDEYQGKFCPSTVMNCITAEATALINYPWWGCFIPPPMVILHSNRHSLIPIGAPPQLMALLDPHRHSSAIIGAAQSASALLSLDWRFDSSFSAPDCISVGAASLEWVLLDLDQERLNFIPHSFPPSLFAMLSIDGLLCWMGTPWPGFAPSNFIPHSSIIVISTPLAHPALHIRHSFLGGSPVFPANSSYCLSHSILILCELTSQFKPFTYHKSIQTTLEFNFTHWPDPNHLEIQGAPPASLCR